ncbi:MAG TPA: phosphodiester glycosidase family protein [Telluria sp.]|nr:phosphodiester glycosidase family protein [Telluria sp.]
MSRTTPFLAGVPVLSLMCTLAWAQPALVPDALPLGRAKLPQSVTSETIAPGIDHYRVRRGAADKSGTWMLMSGVVTTPAGTAQVRKCFDTLGLKASSAAFHMGASEQQRYDIFSGGHYPTRVAAQAAEARARALQCPLYARHSSEDDANASGPWMIDVVALRPGSGGALLAAAGPQGPGLRRQTSSLSKAAGAAVAVNGGFFVERDEDGFPGQPSGISIVDGKLNSGAVNDRPAALLKQGAATILRRIDMAIYLQWQDGSRTTIDGLNRKPGIVRNCGRDPQEKPVHDHTCSYADDVVYFPAGSGFAPATARFGATAIRFAIGTDGMLRRLDAGATPAATEATLAVTSVSERLPDIERQAARHQAAVLKEESRVPGVLSAGAYVVNGGPTLLAAGQEMREEVSEGWGIHVIDDPKHDLLMHDWVNRRNPRTAIGIKDDGTVLLVTVDGHRHDTSVGLTIEELRQVLKALGARDALNLDGGGSTAMVLAGRLINQPSDLTGERAVGDAVMIRPAQGGGK